MAHHRIPTVREHARGYFFVRWGGKDHYLAADRAEAERLFAGTDHPGSLAAYMAWREGERAETIHHRDETRPVTVRDLADLMLADYAAQERRADPGGYFRRHLARFLGVCGSMPLRELCRVDARRSYIPGAIAMARALADDMRCPPLCLAAKTINHDLTAIKRLFAWGAERGHVPELPWRGLRKLPTRRGRPVVLTPRQIRAQVDRAMAHPDAGLRRVGPWLAVNYLTACRPSEVVTLVQMVAGWRGRRRLAPRGPGRPELGRVVDLPAPCDGSACVSAAMLAELLEHKNDWRHEAESEITRLVVLTREARSWLALCEPAWGSLGGYSGACRAAGLEIRPSHCRDSAASHLMAGGAGVEDISLVLGHAPRGEWPSYARAAWHALAGRVEMLSLGVP